MDWIKVESSSIKAIRYSGRTGTLDICFRRDNSVYRYYKVPRFVWAGFKSSASLGKFFNTHIRDVYKYSEFKE